MEAVGSEPVYSDARAARAPRDAAVQRAILEAVSRVAREFLLDQSVDESELSDPGTGWPIGAAGGPRPPLESDPLPPEPAPDYSKIFGRNLVQYTDHYRILEDRGERPALFAQDARVESEYVVIVEVYVDVLRVRHRLEEAGLVAPAGELPVTRRVVLEVRGLRVYPAYEALQALLLEKVGATRVVALEFAQDRIRLGVEYASGGPVELLNALYAWSPPELEITPVLSDEDHLTISVEWVPVRAEGPEEPGGLLQRKFQALKDREPVRAAPR